MASKLNTVANIQRIVAYYILLNLNTKVIIHRFPHFTNKSFLFVF